MLAQAGSEMRTNVVEGFGHAGQESKKLERQYSEIDWRRLYNEKQVWKDARGYYTFEMKINIHGEPVHGEKFYVEDVYRFLEKRMAFVMAAIAHSHLEGERTIALLTKAAMEYQYALLTDLYQGFVDLQDGCLILSIEQIKEWLEERMTADGMMEFARDGISGPFGYAQQLCQAMDTALANASNMD